MKLRFQDILGAYITKSTVVNFCWLNKFQGCEMFLRSLVKLNNSVSVQNFVPKFRCSQNKGSSPQTSFISTRNFWILLPNSGENQSKKVFAAFWFYFSLEFRISCCQVGITRQKIEGARHIFPPSVSDPRGRRPIASQKSTPVTNSMIIQLWYFDFAGLYLKGDYLKQAIRKRYPPTGLEPVAYGFPVRCSNSMFLNFIWERAKLFKTNYWLWHAQK